VRQHGRSRKRNTSLAPPFNHPPLRKLSWRTATYRHSANLADHEVQTELLIAIPDINRTSATFIIIEYAQSAARTRNCQVR
ncbi:MAG: hypothetical protein OXI95_07310, partial [bacterium]|nr:hypothetical protein [bacterium]